MPKKKGFIKTTEKKIVSFGKGVRGFSKKATKFERKVQRSPITQFVKGLGESTVREIAGEQALPSSFKKRKRLSNPLDFDLNI